MKKKLSISAEILYMLLNLFHCNILVTKKVAFFLALDQTWALFAFKKGLSALFEDLSLSVFTVQLCIIRIFTNATTFCIFLFLRRISQHGRMVCIKVVAAVCFVLLILISFSGRICCGQPKRDLIRRFYSYLFLPSLLLLASLNY